MGTINAFLTAFHEEVGDVVILLSEKEENLWRYRNKTVIVILNIMQWWIDLNRFVCSCLPKDLSGLTVDTVKFQKSLYLKKRCILHCKLLIAKNI